MSHTNGDESYLGFVFISFNTILTMESREVTRGQEGKILPN